MPFPDPTQSLLHDRLSDWGPRYTETPLGDYPFVRTIAEPWNACTASLFVVLVLVWVVRLRGQFRKFPFLVSCLPILFVGGIGGTLFHALRSSPTFFLMDIVPLYGLGILLSIYLWYQLGPRWSYFIGLITLLGVMQAIGQWILPTQWTVNLSYALLAIIILLPLGMTIWRTRFRFVGWIYSSLACFVIAWICRISDVLQPLPMGTHWLWHIFGAATTWTLSEYVYRLEKDQWAA